MWAYRLIDRKNTGKERESTTYRSAIPRIVKGGNNFSLTWQTWRDKRRLPTTSTWHGGCCIGLFSFWRGGERVLSWTLEKNVKSKIPYFRNWLFFRGWQLNWEKQIFGLTHSFWSRHWLWNKSACWCLHMVDLHLHKESGLGFFDAAVEEKLLRNSSKN